MDSVQDGPEVISEGRCPGQEGCRECVAPPSASAAALATGDCHMLLLRPRERVMRLEGPGPSVAPPCRVRLPAPPGQGQG